ncbi:glycosyltransferase family 2 protein [Pseudomonas sp. SA195]
MVIPSYNSSRTLGAALKSCLEQSVLPYEVIVVDDCGEENMEEIFQAYVDIFKGKGICIKFIRLEVNSGPGVARNTGWDMAEGDFIAFLDSDDKWHPNKLEICRSVLIHNDFALIYHRFSYLEDRSVKSLDQYRVRATDMLSILFRNPSATACFIVKQDLNIRFDSYMKYAEDHDLWLRISYSNKIAFIDGPPLTIVGREIMSAGGLSSDKTAMRLGELRMYYKFCSGVRFVFLPLLVLFSMCKHILAALRNVLSMR